MDDRLADSGHMEIVVELGALMVCTNSMS